MVQNILLKIILRIEIQFYQKNKINSFPFSYQTMHIKNPQNLQHTNQKNPKLNQSLLSNTVEFIQRNQLNDSSSKMQYTFSKSDRFQSKINSISPNKFYQLPQVLRTQRSSSFGYGQKVQFGKQGKYTPSPGEYQILRQFQKQSKKGSTMGLSRQEIKFNDMFKTKSNNNCPQPASYNVSIIQKSPKYSIGERFIYKKKWIDFVPGPGKYNHLQPTTNLVSSISNFRTSPGTKFDKTLKLKQIKTTSLTSPGPGNYKYLSSIKKQGTTFGKAQRINPVTKNKMIGPGPGEYSLFSTFLH